ncbi:MAG: aminopeptidase P family protein [Anaerolineae bacterium]|nr:aminopeptidase P family protein [Anaerolineae bacterium]
MQTRLDKLMTGANDLGLDFLALVPGPTLSYATGLSYFMSERPIVVLVPVDALPAAIVPEFEAGKARAIGMQTFTYMDEDGPALAFHEACATMELSGARVGVESMRMRLMEARYLERYAPGAIIVHADDLFGEVRMCKDRDELQAMRDAVAAAEDAFLTWIGQLHIGMTEREASARLVAAILGSGAEGLAFDPIIAGGPNGGLPHAKPGERAFQSGDWVVVDWGARINGYVSDLTRMLVFGQPQGVMRDIHAVVLAANRAGRGVVAPGLPAEEVDSAARDVINLHGYAEQFTHRCGHGLGLESHEPPYIVQGNTLPLRPGMVFTVEPGIYVPGLGGVRIEDNVVVTETGSETLTTLSRDPYRIQSER